MDSEAAAATAEEIAAFFAGLAVVLRGGEGTPGSCEGAPGSCGGDPVRRWADECLDGLAGVARAEARMASVKVYLAAGFADCVQAMAAPATSPEDHTGQEMAVVAE